MKTCEKEEHKVPVDVRGTKTSVLKLPINSEERPKIYLQTKISVSEAHIFGSFPASI